MTRSGSVSLNGSKGVEAQRGLNLRLLCLCRGLKFAAHRKCANTGFDRVFGPGDVWMERLYWKVCLASILGAKKG
jgi:hypothetical protein